MVNRIDMPNENILHFIDRKDGTISLSGIIGEAINEFSRRYNFKQKIIIQYDSQAQSEIPEFLIIIQTMFRYIKELHLTPPIISLPFTFVVTRGLPYTPMEKFLLPFDDSTWILVLLITFIAYIVILIVSHLSINTQHFVFGRRIRYPYFNVLQTFFGVSLSRLPGRNFARFFMTAFVLYCLVIRTAYQGKMFQQITGNVRKPTPTSVSELLASNYPIFVAIDEVIQLEE